MDSYFVKNNSDEIILFFLGWGMDYRPVLPIKTSRDIVYFYNYNSLDSNYSFEELKKYKKRYVIAYSAGVSISKLLKLEKYNIEKSYMINGTMNLLDKKYGLTSEIIDVFKNINLGNYMDFRKKYLVSNDKELKYFNSNEPLRSVESSILELNALNNYNYSKIKKEEYKFDKIYLAKDDKIFNIEIQKEFWKDNDYKIISGNHFPFLYFSSLDEIIN